METNRNNPKRLLSLFTAVAMTASVFSTVVIPASADELGETTDVSAGEVSIAETDEPIVTDEPTNVTDSGTCGDNVTWVLYDDGTLEISGTGDMWDYEDQNDVPWNSYRDEITSVIVNDGVTSIGSCVFYELANLTAVTMSDSVTNIGSYAFYACSLTEVTMSDSITNIGSYAFYDCGSLTDVIIPESVTSIGDYAFNGCNLTEVTIPANVISMGRGVFGGCINLEQVTILAKLTSISNSTFGSCLSLTSITIPDGVTSIGASAFYYCSGLTEVIIPTSVTEIGDGAFNYCYRLPSSTVYYEGTEDEWNAIAIGSNNEYLTSAQIICSDTTTEPTDEPTTTDPTAVLTNISGDDSELIYDITLTGMDESDVFTSLQINLALDADYYDTDNLATTIDETFTGADIAYNESNGTVVVVWVAIGTAQPTVEYTEGMSIGTITIPVREEASGSDEVVIAKFILSRSDADKYLYAIGLIDSTVGDTLSAYIAEAEIPTPEPTPGECVFTYTDGVVYDWSGSCNMLTLTEDDDSYIQLQAAGSSIYSATYDLPSAAQLEDNYVIEYDTKITKSNSMGRYGRYTQIAFVGTNPTLDTRDYGVYGELLGGITASETGQGYVTSIASSLSARYGLDGIIVNDDGTEELATDNTSEDIPVEEWVRVQTAVSGGVATVTVIDASGTKLVDGKEYVASADKLSQIYVTTGRGDDAAGPGTVCLDNVKIYTGAAAELTTDGLRTNEPAPEVEAPSNTFFSSDFNSVEAGTILSIKTEDQDPDESIEGLRFYIGTRSSGSDSATKAAIVEYLEGDNVLRLAAGQYATGGRGPVMEIVDSPSVLDTESTIGMEFAVKLATATSSGAGRLYFIKDRTQTGSDSTGEYRNVAAVLTTDGIGSEITRNGTDVIGIDVEADEWMTVKFEIDASQDYRVYINGEQVLNGDYVASGDNASKLETLPMLAVQSSSASDSAVNYRSIVTIDNFVAYGGEAATPEPTEQPENVTASGTCGDDLTWVLYDDGTLEISGTGDMTDYGSYSYVPWYSNRSSITEIIIGDEVTSIGDYASHTFFAVVTSTFRGGRETRPPHTPVLPMNR